MSRYLWLGGVASPEDFEKQIQLGNKDIAANKTQLKFIKGIEYNLDMTFDIISGHLLRTFPEHKKLISSYERWSHAEDAIDVQVPFTSLPVFRLASKAISMAFFALRWGRSIKEEKVVFIYTMHSPYLFAGMMMKIFLRNVIICLIVPDLPIYMDLSRTKWKSMLKEIEMKMMNNMLGSVDSFILFSKHMVEEIPIEKKLYKVIECLVDYDEVGKVTKKDSHKRILMYSGYLEKKHGIGALLEAFTNIEGEEYELRITGNGNMVPEIKAYAKKDSRINYLGFLPTKEALTEKQMESSLLINLRDPEHPASRYCFPSKLVDYMIKGIPVLSVRMDGIPVDYYEYIYTIDSIDSEVIKDKILEIFSQNHDIRATIGQNAKTYVLENKNIIKYTEQVIDLLKETKAYRRKL